MKKYKKLVTAMGKAIRDIETNDAEVLSVEIHGRHSGYRIETDGAGAWTSTEIEK
jgi:hypothetical protein